MCAAARMAGRPVKWVEDRLEHLHAAASATNRVTTPEGGGRGGRPHHGAALDQLEDCGAYLRAPEPATLYRMHGNLTGAYAIRHVAHAQPRGADQQDADRPQCAASAGRRSISRSSG